MKQQVKCPICKHRLFDTEENSIGLITIKCKKCGQVSTIRLERKSLIRNYNVIPIEARGV